MAVKHLLFFQALGPGGDHILLANFVQKRVLGQQREGSEPADHVCGHWQGEMPEIISNLLVPGHLVKTRRGQAPEREQIEIATAGKQYDQQDGKQESGNGVADHDRGTGPDIEPGAIRDRLTDAQWNGDEVDNQRGPEAEGNGDRHLVQNQFDDASVPEKGIAEIEGGVIAQHSEKAFVRRLVEAVHGLKFFKKFGRQAPGGPAVSGTARHFTADIATTGARQSAAAVAFHLRENLFNGATGSGLNNDKIQQHDPHQGGDDQGEAAEYVNAHSGSSPYYSVVIANGISVHSTSC